MLFKLPEPAVLTQYPPEYYSGSSGGSLGSEPNEPLNTSVVRSGLYIKRFGPEGFFRLQSDVISNYGLLPVKYPYSSKAWSACFSFSKGSIVKDAPYDSDISNVFFGEEMDITLKLFRKGYHMFSPNETLVFTKFIKTDRHRWNCLNCNDNKKLMDRIRHGSCMLSDYLKFADDGKAIRRRK
jgi:hypothetical protein